MSDIQLDEIKSGYNLSKINSNFTKLEAANNNTALHRSGGNNTMEQELDMNSNRIINVAEPVDGTDIVSKDYVDEVLIEANLAKDIANASANYQGDWFVGATVLKGQTWSYNGLTYASKVDNAGEPIEGANWLLINMEDLTLKMFQSPTDNLTKVEVFSGGVGVVYEVRKTFDNSLATIYSDKDGTTEIPQNGVDNVSNNDTECVFYVGAGEYTIVINSSTLNFTITNVYGIKFNTLDDLINAPIPTYRIGDTVKLKERVSGYGGGAPWLIVDATTVTPNDAQIVASLSNPDLAFEIKGWRDNKIKVKKWGAIPSPANSITGFDNSPITQKMFDAAADNGLGEIDWGGEWFYFASNVNQKIVNDRLGTNSLIMRGRGKNSTVLFTSQAIDMFTHQDAFIVKDLSFAQQGLDGLTKYTGTALRANGQCRKCNFDNIEIFWFKFGQIQRFSLWNSFKNIAYNDNLCGLKLARHVDMENPSNPSATNFWNLANITGSNTKTFEAGTLQDTTKTFIVDELIGHRITNSTKGVSGTITANTVNTITVSWDSGSPTWGPGDSYTISSSGWFHNANTFDNIVFNGGKESSGGRGEIGFWGAVQGCTFTNITSQNYERASSANFQTIPTDQVSTAFQIEGGGPTSTRAYGNLINGLYIERSFKALKITNQDQLTINQLFTQGQAGGETLLEVTSSTVSITGQSNQSGGWTADLIAVDSNITIDRPLQSSGGDSGRSLTNTYFSENGIKISPTIKIKEVTATTEFGAVVTLDSAANTISYERQNNLVTISGRLDVSSTASTSGSFISIDGLPFTVANPVERAGNGGGAMPVIGGASPELAPYLVLENESSVRVYTDLTTITGKQLYFTISYFTSDFS